jgi:outer membrane cobalamin receptor
MENSGKIELKRILTCMKDYEYDETSLEPGDFDGSYKFNLTTRPDYSSDETIKVTIEFSTAFDDENTYEKDDENFLYNDENNYNAHDFINKLITHNSTKKGGQKKKQKKKQRKTRKNKKK